MHVLDRAVVHHRAVGTTRRHDRDFAREVDELLDSGMPSCCIQSAQGPGTAQCSLARLAGTDMPWLRDHATLVFRLCALLTHSLPLPHS